MRCHSSLGPDSLTWRHFGDLRSALLILRTGTLQAMHPAIGAALVEHSDVFENPWNRLLRSVPPILGVVYGPEPDQTGAAVRDYHRHVKGRDTQGRDYRALAPDTYYWAHATFFESQLATAEFFGRPLTLEEKRRLYAESADWYALYGVTSRPAPPDFAAFEDYWRETVESVLEATEPALWGFASADSWPAPFRRLGGPQWFLLRRPVGSTLTWIARGTLGPVVRERLGLSWSSTDERVLRAFAWLVRILWWLLPGNLGMASAARKAYRREGAPADRGLQAEARVA